MTESSTMEMPKSKKKKSNSKESKDCEENYSRGHFPAEKSQKDNSTSQNGKGCRVSISEAKEFQSQEEPDETQVI